MGINTIYKLFSQNYLIDIDSRKIRQGSLFFALKGDNFNGNKFALESLKIGADYAIVDEDLCKHPKIILVDNVLKTLQKLANHHRKTLNIPIISITGSNGKTTTKELISAVLLEKFNITSTIGNLNNHIGVPLTLLSMNKETEIGIVEMGANHLKEIEFLCKIAEPNYGLITNFGKAHLEGFGSLDGVITAKSELYNFLKASKGKAFVNSDDELQMKQSKGIERLEFNSKIVEYIDANPFVKVKFSNLIFQSNLIGKYNYGNISSAIAIGKYFNVKDSDIKNAIENYIPKNNRSQIIEKDTNKIILDAYNANPSSMKVALENFNLLNPTKKIAFLGDMFELGEDSVIEHQIIAELATSFNFDKVFLIGKNFNKTKVQNVIKYDSFNDLKKSYNKFHYKKCSILIKGSRGMALERILELL